MKTRSGVVWLAFLAALSISRLAAQDVTVTDPAWFDAENAPADQPPTFKKRPKPDFPDEMKKSDRVGYAFVPKWIDAKGDAASSPIVATNPYFEKALAGERPKFNPAVRAGDKPVEALCWFGVIFNPATAHEKGPEATPRLLQFAPLTIPKKSLPPGMKTPLVVWTTAKVDEKGVPTNLVFEESVNEVFRQPIESGLPNWRFAPARKNGQAVAAELRVPFLVMGSIKAPTQGKMTPPKLLNTLSLVYPNKMKRTGLIGEVLVAFVVNTKGEVTNPVVVRSNNPGFDEAAIDGALSLKFRPATRNGQLVDAKIQMPFVFSLGSGGRELMEVGSKGKKTPGKLPPELQFDIAPKIEGVMNPVYPYELLRAGTKGKAKVAMLIDEKGAVQELRVVEATDPAFGQALIAAVRGFRFTPALKDGRPTKALLAREQTFDPSGFKNFPSDDDFKLLRLEKKKPETIVSAKELDTPLKPLSRRAPLYPLGTDLPEGKATVEVLIDEEGVAHLPRVIEASEPAFGFSAAQAAATWRFEPPKAGGKRVVVRAQVPFRFKLDAKQQAALSQQGISVETSGAKAPATEEKPNADVGEGK